ncbi:substance-K receptor-like [Branchiostoma lanceolatum]|uniref:substance-K receptor-like n=1 Tax=Branchiostoma lanceolatum TaxID=7740 RepID=UPI0034517A89
MTQEYGTVTVPIAMVGNRSAVTPQMGNGLSPAAIGLQATAYVILFIIGVILNTCVLLVVYKNRTMRNVTNMFIVSLSVVDLVTLLAVVPFVIAATVTDDWPFGGEFCQFAGFLAVSLRNVSIISVAGVAVDRYFVIVRPFAPKVTKSRAWKLIAFIWWTGFVSCVPPLFGFGMYTYSTGKHFCALHWAGGGSALAYSMYLVSVIFLGSLVVVIFSYYLILQTTREQMKKSTLNGLSPSAQHGRNGATSPLSQGKALRSPTLSSVVPVENRTTQTVILVIVAFLVTWTPYFLLNLYRGLAQDKTIASVGDFITTWLSFSCCVFNPILYGALNYRFRKSFQELCSNWTFSLSRVTEFLERMKGGQGSGRRDGSRYVPEQPEGGTLSRSYENTPVARRSQKTLAAGGSNGQAGARQDRGRRTPGVRTLERRPSLPTTRTESSLARGVYAQNGVPRPGSSLARNLPPRAGSALGRSVTPTGTPRIPPSLVRSRTPTNAHRLMYSLPRSTTPTAEMTAAGTGRATTATTPRLPPRPPPRTDHHPRPPSRNDPLPRPSSRNDHPQRPPTRNDPRPPSRNESPLQSPSGNDNPPPQLSRTVADVHLEAVF